MTKGWDVVKDTITNVEETRPVMQISKVQNFTCSTANKLLEKLPNLRLPIPAPPWLLPDMTPAPPPPPPGLATLWGIVTDANTGNPIEGIDVSLGDWSATTTSDGRYEFADVEPGTYTLIFSDPLGRYQTKEV